MNFIVYLHQQGQQQGRQQQRHIRHLKFLDVFASDSDSLFFFCRFGAPCKEMLAVEQEIFQEYVE